MCTNTCPCPADLDLSKWNSDITYPNNRSASIKSETVNGSTYAGFTLSSGTNYKTFWDCYKSVK